jgi:hypothetical protein
LGYLKYNIFLALFLLAIFANNTILHADSSKSEVPVICTSGNRIVKTPLSERIARYQEKRSLLAELERVVMPSEEGKYSDKDKARDEDLRYKLLLEKYTSSQFEFGRRAKANQEYYLALSYFKQVFLDYQIKERVEKLEAVALEIVDCYTTIVNMGDGSVKKDLAQWTSILKKFRKKIKKRGGYFVHSNKRSFESRKAPKQDIENSDHKNLEGSKKVPRTTASFGS